MTVQIGALRVRRRSRRAGNRPNATAVPCLETACPAVRSQPPTSLRGEAGFTLIEVLVTATLMLVVVGAVLTVMENTVRVSAQDRERALAIREAEAQLGRLVREARGAYRVHAATATRLDLDVHAQGVSRRVAFDCSGGRCTRQELNPDGTAKGPAATIVARVVAGSQVFATTADASGKVTYVAVTLRVPASGERGVGYQHEIRLHDGIALRNAGIVA